MSPEYKCFRKDRSNSNIECVMGGGVLIAVRKDIDGDEFFMDETKDLEAICVRVSLTNSSLYLNCLYIQPTAPIETYIDHLRAIDKIEDSMSLGDISLYCGDWNLPNTKWINDEDGLGLMPIIGDSECAKAIVTRRVTDHLLNRGSSQLCNLTNKYGNVLDLIHTNMPELSLVEKADMLIIPEEISDAAHVQIAVTIECEPALGNSNTSTKSINCFKKANFEEMRNFFGAIDYSYLYNMLDINEMVDSLYAILYDAIDKFVPKASIRSNNKPIWYDNKLTNLKNVMSRQYKKLGNKPKVNRDADEGDFKRAQADFCEYQKIHYHEHIKDISNCSKSDPKRFWKYINGKRTSNTIPKKLSYEGTTVTEDREKAKMFANFFSSV
ncbi:uncharacterized protein LOC129571064 [Sitodiplosis mosellana]|uniref:uncharacterized protein LOC129571064 n=1 Tax=Sitodiplosis mosellana TaxID=263140 RepID=UPI0024439467|nr:uncharacterized protein LOC129571064 [Sitodiplosis mosellana]